MQFTRSFTKKINEQLKGIGLYQSQWSIVYYLKQFGPATIVEISQYLDVEKPTISRTVDRLEQRELVKRIPTRDKRERRIGLTEKGIDIYKEAKKAVAEFEQNLLDGISEEDRETTARTIQLLREKLK